MPVYDFTCHMCGHEENTKLAKHDEEVACSKCLSRKSYVTMDRKFPKPSFVVIGGEYRKMKIK